MPSAGSAAWGTGKTAIARSTEPGTHWDAAAGQWYTVAYPGAPPVPTTKPPVPPADFNMDELLKSPWLWVALGAVVFLSMKKK